jgi:hypothetical protein
MEEQLTQLPSAGSSDPATNTDPAAVLLMDGVAVEGVPRWCQLWRCIDREKNVI